MYMLHLGLKTTSVALLTRSYMCWIELTWQSSLLLQRGRPERLTGNRCVSLQHVLRFHIVSMLYLAPVAVEGA